MPDNVVLIVENDHDIARAIALRLRANGYQTLIAPDAYHATRLARKQTPNLVIMDVYLPAGDGFRVHETINGMPGAPVPVIYVTGARGGDVAEKALALGARRVFAKPLDMDEFMSAVRESAPQ